MKKNGLTPGQIARRFAVPLSILFCAVLLGLHFLAWTKARFGLAGFLVVDDRTKADYDTWLYFQEHMLIGIGYCALVVGLSPAVGRKKDALSLISWSALPVLLAAGIWYLLV